MEMSPLRTGGADRPTSVSGLGVSAATVDFFSPQVAARCLVQWPGKKFCKFDKECNVYVSEKWNGILLMCMFPSEMLKVGKD